jgi:hypothetical protein
MTAIITVILLLLIRLWTRADTNSKTAKTIEKIGNAATSATNSEAAEYIKEGLSLKSDSASGLDILLIGEIFVASFASGLIIKAAW